MIKNIIAEIFDRTTPPLLKENSIASKEFIFNIEKGHTISENIYRQGSKKYFDIINEARTLYETGKVELNKYDLELINTDVGKTAIVNEELVYLDFPYIDDSIEETKEYEIQLVESCCKTITEAKKKRKRKSKSKSKKNDKKPLNKPMRDSSGSSKYKVYVKDPKTGNIKTVRFGAKGMTVGINNPKRVKSFVARHRCKTHANDKTKAAYWSCRLPRYFGNSGKKWW
jgi:hypothetical protein